MNQQPLSVAARREALRLRCARQREQLSATAAALSGPLLRIDRGMLVFKRLRIGPTALGLGAALLASLPAYRYFSRALMLFRTVRGLLSKRP